MKKYVYICAPYRATCETEIERNIKRVQQCAKNLWDKGYIPIYTHGIYSWLPETEENRQKILDLCKRLIDICDVIYILRQLIGSKDKGNYNNITEGMRIELQYAKMKKKKIIWC